MYPPSSEKPNIIENQSPRGSGYLSVSPNGKNFAFVSSCGGAGVGKEVVEEEVDEEEVEEEDEDDGDAEEGEREEGEGDEDAEEGEGGDEGEGDEDTGEVGPDKRNDRA